MYFSYFHSAENGATPAVRLIAPYAPWDGEAEALIAEAGGNIYDVYPAAYLHLKPQLKIDGEVKGDFSDAISMGLPEYLWVETLYPGENFPSGRHTENVIHAGDIVSIVIDNQKIVKQDIDDSLAKMLEAMDEGADQENSLGEYYRLGGLRYWMKLDAYNDWLAADLGVAYTRSPSAILVGHKVEYSMLFGLAPVSARQHRMFFDLDRDVYHPLPREGAPGVSTAWMISSGFRGSALEAEVLEEVFTYAAASAVTILARASNNDVPVYLLDADNVDELLPNISLVKQSPSSDDPYEAKRLSDLEKAERDLVRSFVSRGYLVAIPAETFDIGEWSGSGYIALDPRTGSGSYMISGGLGGSATIRSLEKFLRRYHMDDPAAALDEFFTYCGAQPYCGLVDPYDINYDDLGNVKIDTPEELKALVQQNYLRKLTEVSVQSPDFTFGGGNYLHYLLMMSLISAPSGGTPDGCEILLSPSNVESGTVLDNVSGYFRNQMPGPDPEWEYFDIHLTPACFTSEGQAIEVAIQVEELPNAIGQMEHNPLILISESGEETSYPTSLTVLDEFVGKLKFARTQNMVKRAKLSIEAYTKYFPINQDKKYIIFSFDDGPVSPESESGENQTIEIAKKMRQDHNQSSIFFVLTEANQEVNPPGGIWQGMGYKPNRPVAKQTVETYGHLIGIHGGTPVFDENGKKMLGATGHADADLHQNLVMIEKKYDVYMLEEGQKISTRTESGDPQFDGKIDGENGLESSLLLGIDTIKYSIFPDYQVRYVRSLQGDAIYYNNCMKMYGDMNLKHIHWDIESKDKYGSSNYDIFTLIYLLFFEEKVHKLGSGLYVARRPENNVIVVLMHDTQHVWLEQTLVNKTALKESIDAYLGHEVSQEELDGTWKYMKDKDNNNINNLDLYIFVLESYFKKNSRYPSEVEYPESPADLAWLLEFWSKAK